MPAYLVNRRFDPTCEGWAAFVAWARLPQLEALRSVDGILCPLALTVYIDADWDHLLDPAHFAVFTSAAWALQRTPLDPGAQLLRVEIAPSEEVPGCDGYDLVDAVGGVSALCNCGGFDEVFLPTELNRWGLLDDLDRARVVQAELQRRYPEDHHARCLIVAVQRQSTKDPCVRG